MKRFISTPSKVSSLISLLFSAALAPASAQLFENLERFASRVPVGDPEVIVDGNEGPKSICLRDMDEDGRPDIVTANLDGTVSLSFGQGGLEFEPPVHLRTETSTLRGLICEDLNSDGRIDIAAAAPPEGEVVFFWNEGERAFSQPRRLATWKTARNLVAGDFNGDGRQDLAVGGRDRGVVWYENDGLGNFAEKGNDETLRSGDWDEGWRPVYSMERIARPSAETATGVADWLIATHANENRLWIMRVGSDGNFNSEQLLLGHFPHSLALGVISRAGDEGAPNLLTAEKDAGTIQLFAADPQAWEDGTLAFGEVLQIIQVPGAPRDLELADLNGDGWNDLTVVLRNFNRLIIYHNEAGLLKPVTETPVGTSPRELASAHLNDDELKDFVVINRESQDVSVLLASDEGTGFQALDQVYPVSGDVAGLELFDLNGDGRDDVIQLHRSSGDVSVRLAGPNGQLEQPEYYYMGVLPSGFEFRDLNGDGSMDIMTANLGRQGYANGEVALRLGNPDGSFGSTRRVPTEDGARIFAIEAADFNDDQILDFAVGYFDCRISFFEGLPDGTLVLRRTDLFTYESRVMVTGDFDQDGDIDIAGAGYAGDVVVLENEGDLLTTQNQKRYEYPPRQSSKFGTREIRAVDVNGDGDLDLLVGSGKGVMLLLGAEGVTFEPQPDPLKGAEFPASSMAEGDMDGDGIADLAVSCRILACVTILKGGEDGEFLPAVTVDVPAGDFVRVGDVDGDGLTDLVGSGDALWVALSSRGPESGPPLTWKTRRPPMPQVVINEILPSNSRYRFTESETETADAIELYNGATTSADLTGWNIERIQKLDDGGVERRDYTLPTASLGPDERLVLFASNQGRSEFHTGFKLPASGARLALRDAEGNLVDDVEYPPMEPDHSFARYQDGVQAFRHNLFPDIGSANVDNGELEPTLFFDGFDFEQLAPNRALRVTARANDDVGVIALNLVYRPIGSAAGGPEHIVLYDDGQHDDGGILDGLFAGVLPGFAEGSEMQFYVEATDLNNRTTYLPDGPAFASTREQLQKDVYTIGFTDGIPGLEISEVVTDNETILTHGGIMLGSDYVELRNFGRQTIALGGLMLARSFSADGGSLYIFPVMGEAGIASFLRPGESIVVGFSDSPSGHYVAPFTLRKNGETVFLMSESPLGARVLLDYVQTPELGDDEALFRSAPGGTWLRGPATPGMPNLVIEAPELVLLSGDTEFAQFRFPTETGVIYRVEASSTLAADSWQMLQEVEGHGFVHTVENERIGPRLFYRVGVEE